MLTPIALYILIGCSSFTGLALYKNMPPKQPPVLTTEQLQSTPPIVYHPAYNINPLPWPFGWIAQLIHPFDGNKYGKVAHYLQKNLKLPHFHAPLEPVSDEDLQKVHTPRYLASLNNSSIIAEILNIDLLGWLPMWFFRRVLNPMRLATQGTVLAAGLALERGWAINLSGGYHHAKSDSGEGFCCFNDIAVAMRQVRQKNPNLKILYVDLDAHQGNGVEQYVLEEREKTESEAKNTYIFDVYNSDIYPKDIRAKSAINANMFINSGCEDEQYLGTLCGNLKFAIKTFEPDFIIYNAGTDVLKGDRLGQLSVTEEGIRKRDEFVWHQALKRKIPILMVLSGGYTSRSAGVIGGSLQNILTKFKLVDPKK
jgi:histone deacetylase 11